MSFPISTPEVTRWCMLFIAITLFFPTAFSVMDAVQAERTGVALYSPNPRLPATERVTKTASPKKFRKAVNMSWFFALLFGGIAYAAFVFYRRLSN